MTDISVIAPTRGRVDLLNRMLDSLYATVSGQYGVEVILRTDFDDPVTWQNLAARHIPCIIGPRKNGYATLASLVNECARLSTGQLVLVVNDDAVFQTAGWDHKLVEAASMYPDGIFDFGVTTIMNNENFVFPCTSRQMVNLIGIHDEHVIYSDIWLRDVMTAFGRAIRLPDVVIEHQWAGMSDDQRQALGQFSTATYPIRVDEAIKRIAAYRQVAAC